MTGPIIFFNEDVESYYESYTDGVYVGNPAVTFDSPSLWNRKRVGSKTLASSSAYTEALLLSVFLEGEANLAATYGGNSRVLKLFDRGVFYADSVAPNIAKIFTTGSFGSGSVCFPLDDAPGFFDLIGNNTYFTAFFSTNGYLTSSNNGQRISNTEWQYSFPFEKKYQLLDLGNVYAASGLVGSINDLDFRYKSGSIVPIDRINMNIAFVSGTLANSQLGTKTYTFYTERTRPGISSEFDTIIPTSNEQSFGYAAKAVYGIKPTPVSSLTYAPAPSSGDTYKFVSGAFVEGWRYGLSSGIQTNPYTVFLPDRFGQPYNLLYSSPQSALVPVSGSSGLFGDYGPLSVNGGVSFVSGSALTGEQDMWLTASIYSGSNVSAAYTVNPKCSGIYDRFCRAGMPWFDDDERLTQ